RVGHHGRPQAPGRVVHRLRPRLSRRRRNRGHDPADPARRAAQRLRLAAGLQQPVHDARHDDDLLRRHALVFGFANYLVPLMIGARDMAFPRLNAFSFWLTAFGGVLLYWSFIGGSGLYGAGNAPDVGWWAYAPLTARAFSKGHSTDYWTLA